MGETGRKTSAITIEGLTKRFAAGHAVVDDLSFSVEAGTVTGFLGPNGAGKTTTFRMLLGLVAPSAGSATFGGTAYRDLVFPSRRVGAVLDGSGFHPRRSARNHLRVAAAVAAVPESRIDALLAEVDLADDAHRPVQQFSLGMRQRLSLATALLGDPQVLILDEPANGLDPAGTQWLRHFLRKVAAEGRAVLVSSHVLSEVSQMVDNVVIISEGRLVTQSSLAELARPPRPVIRILTPQAQSLSALLRSRGVKVEFVKVESGGASELAVHGTTSEAVGRMVASCAGRIAIYEMTPQLANLEETFLQLTTATPLLALGVAVEVEPQTVLGPRLMVATP